MNPATYPQHDRVAECAERAFDVPEGFARIEYANASDFIPIHYHPTDLTLQVLHGSATVVMDGRAVRLGAGQQLTIPAELFHSTYFGRDGCTYKLLRPKELRRIRKGARTHV